MKRFSLIFAIIMVAIAMIANDAQAARGRRRGGGGGGGMGGGAAAGNGLCNMRVSSAVRPGQCVNGNCGLGAEPTPAVAPAVGGVSFGDEIDGDTDAIAEYRVAAHRVKSAASVNPSTASLVSFDADPAAPVSFDAPVPIVSKLARR